jgi:hypothetical protein
MFVIINTLTGNLASVVLNRTLAKAEINRLREANPNGKYMLCYLMVEGE